MRFLFLLLLFVSVDSKVYREVQLTDSGIHSSPRFDKNGTSIHVVANGGQYETDCDHVYRIDLRTPQQPISLVSLGIGQEDGPSFGTSIFSSTDLYGLRTAGVNMVMKTTRNNAFTNNKFCLRKICSNPTDVIRDACNRPHIERFRDSEYAFFNPTTTFEDSQVSTSPNVPLRVQNRALESHVYTLLGTSVNYYDLPFNKTSQSYIRTNSLINGFDAFSDLGDAKVIFHAAPVGDDGSALEAGVEVLDKYEIYETTWNDLANGNFKVQTPIVKKPTNGYLTNPRFLRDGTNRFFYTFTDLIGNSQIRLHTPGQLNDDMVLDQAKDIDVFYKDSTIFVTYVSNKNGKNWQVYMGTYNADTQFPTISVPSPVAYDSRTPFFENTRSIYKPEFETPFHLRFSDNGDWLMFAGEENYDILQIDLHLNTTNIARRLSPGLRFHESPAFLGLDGRNDIFMVSRISDSGICQLPKADNRWKCYNNPCYYLTSERFDAACKKVGYDWGRFLSNYNEIYQVNQFGTIKERVTKNEFYEGELSLSPDKKLMVFSSNRDTDGDYDLYIASAMGSSVPTRITNMLGFEGGVSFRPDGGAIAYFAWRPTSEDEKARYLLLRKYWYTDTGYCDIFYMELDNLQEVQLTHMSAIGGIQAPSFNPTGDKIYFLRKIKGSEFGFGSILYSIDVATKQLKQLYRISDFLDNFVIGPNGNIAYTAIREIIVGRLNENPQLPPSTTPSGTSALKACLLTFLSFLLCKLF